MLPLPTVTTVGTCFSDKTVAEKYQIKKRENLKSIFYKTFAADIKLAR